MTSERALQRAKQFFTLLKATWNTRVSARSSDVDHVPTHTMQSPGTLYAPGKKPGLIRTVPPPHRCETIALTMLVAFVPACPGALAHEGLVAGYVEEVRIDPEGLTLRAKLDTGAKHSSLNATDVEKFSRDGQTWVRFPVTNEANRSLVIERPVRRVTRIRRHANQFQERDVLLLGICLGSVFKEVEVNIIDRTGFNYQMVIGRSFLSGDFLVDAGKSFLLKPDCAEKSGK